MNELACWGRALRRGSIQRIRTIGPWLLGGLLLGIVSLAVGCATGRIIGETYRDPEKGFQVRLPPAGWRPRPLDGAALSFASPELRAAMALRAECSSPEPGELPWVARHLFFGLQDKRIEEQDSVRLPGTLGIRTRLTARLDDRPVEVEGVTFRRGGCLYDFMYVAPPAAFPQGRADFEAFVESWRPLAEQ